MFSPSVAQARRLEAQARRKSELYRALKRELPVRLTARQKIALNRAVNLTHKAELAALDPDITANDLVRLDRCAAAARAAWSRVADTHKQQHREAVPTLQELMAGAHG
jgi:hypothetical protein